MHPTLMYDYARARMTDEQNAADRRRLARIAKESRSAKKGDSSIVGRVWDLLTGVNPGTPALKGSSS